jgi:cobalamin biosynthesis protein CobD/CbiB
MDRNRLWVPALTLLLDLVAGDPPNQYHPVAWMGTTTQAARCRAPRPGRLGPGAGATPALPTPASAVAGSRGPAAWMLLYVRQKTEEILTAAESALAIQPRPEVVALSHEST